jgi:two-component system, OmpR family, response regulator RegX3
MDRILVLSDDLRQQQMVRQVLEPVGYEVVTASTDESAIDIFLITKPGLVVLDLCLNGESGEELCRQIRQISKATPILVLSDNRDVTEVVLLLELGANDYMMKPFSALEFLARVKTSLRYLKSS